METLRVELTNCHGVRELSHTFSFERGNALAIYAPNGTMKSSFARTLSDFAKGEESRDHVFPDRTSSRSILDQDGNEPAQDDVAVFLAYDEEYASSEFASTLLVNAELRTEFEKIQKRLIGLEQGLVKALKTTARTRVDVASLISQIVTQQDANFFGALVRLEYEVSQLEDAPFAEVPHDLLFNSSVDKVIRNPALQAVLAEYVVRLNELLDDSTFFSRESFTYYNAETVNKSLASQGFFEANHSLLLSGDSTPRQVTSKEELEELITEEKQRITEDPALSKKLTALEKAITSNQATRDFFAYISEHQELLPRLANLDQFHQEVWKSYLKVNEDLFLQAVEGYKGSEQREKEIKQQAAAEKTKWEGVIDLFNSRFHVPFTLVPRNREKVVVAQDEFLTLDFEFKEGGESNQVDREHLLKVLSTGEKKALYILNVLFEVEARRGSGKKTLFVIDDIADSFDYKNKYAIIQYLKEIREHEEFRLIILTHNFDFLRTIFGRQVVGHGCCFMAEKSKERVSLSPMDGSTITNPFTRDFRKHIFSDGMKRIAAIPFVRNLVEYTKDTSDPGYQTLTSLIHWKKESRAITHGDLDAIFTATVGGTTGSAWDDSTGSVLDLIFSEADAAIDADEGVNFANKIVLSIAIRLLAESYMVSAIGDSTFTDAITSHQTPKLYKELKRRGVGDTASHETLDTVLLMTPENIHINSFMYEPILDMSDASLRDLYKRVKALSVEPEASIA
ncbi:hypothetical protein [Microbacterium sp. KR10-403]|uniref:hypothetical protein n=1 Tax=Microbacterium sp. KR10-403 TaxID=3158581 RepID=UPI0032E4D94C